MSEKQAEPIEVRDIKLPRVKRVKKLMDVNQIAEYFARDFTCDEPAEGEREHYMQLYALTAAFDADISREAFFDLAVDVLNMRGRSAACTVLQMVAVHHANAMLTPEMLVKSHGANRNGVNADAAEINRQLGLIAQCRSQEDAVN